MKIIEVIFIILIGFSIYQIGYRSGHMQGYDEGLKDAKKYIQGVKEKMTVKDLIYIAFLPKCLLIQ